MLTPEETKKALERRLYKIVNNYRTLQNVIDYRMNGAGITFIRKDEWFIEKMTYNLDGTFTIVIETTDCRANLVYEMGAIELCKTLYNKTLWCFYA